MSHDSNTRPMGAWLMLCLCTLAWDAGGLDLPVMRLIGTPKGFAWQHHPLLEGVLHDGGRCLSTLAYLLLWGWALAPAGSGPSRRERWAVLTLVTLSLLSVGLAKHASRSSCPWEWREFGGTAVYTSHWKLWASDGGTGRCFPGGHASSALAFLALCLPWLCPPVVGRSAANGRRWLRVVLVAGGVAGLTQTLRGAHPPSHTLWTALLCGGIALGGWRLARPWLRIGLAQRPVMP
ncbi:MAG: phosphatase PAP2 family protein [Gemmobacter sp.]|nr:phosphatase PAP2 family protein [Gemmobacter sp.]